MSNPNNAQTPIERMAQDLITHLQNQNIRPADLSVGLVARQLTDLAAKRGLAIIADPGPLVCYTSVDHYPSVGRWSIPDRCQDWGLHELETAIEHAKHLGGQRVAGVHLLHRRDLP